MKSPTLLFMFMLCSIIYDNLSGQSTDKYETETIYFQGSKYVKNGNEYPIGFLANRLKEEMQVSPEAVVLFDKYKKQRSWSFGLGLLSLGAIITAASVKNEDLRMGLFVGGLASSVAASPFSYAAGKNLQKSVWVRNRDVLK